jgi:4-hydroxy-tetrahydrodipicolinate reductase
LKPIRVVVHGALGRMGQEVINALCHEPETEIVGAVDLDVPQNQLSLPDGSGSVPLSSNLDEILSGQQPDVLVDFTIARATMPAVRIATRRKTNLVIGTTGLTADDLDEIDRLATDNGVGAVIAPNFALGAVLMMHLARIAARYLDYAEIIEMHHDRKADAPSGTALNTARDMAQARGKPFSRTADREKEMKSRGDEIENIPIHAVRLPGLLAHQEVILGALGQTLRIRHDMLSREGFMPGVIIAVKEVVKRQGLVRSLDALLGLEED